MGRISEVSKRTVKKSAAATARGAARLAKKGIKAGYDTQRRRDKRRSD